MSSLTSYLHSWRTDPEWCCCRRWCIHAARSCWLLSHEWLCGGWGEVAHLHDHLIYSPSSTSNPSLFPLLEVSGDSGPCYVAPPFLVEERKGEGVKAPAHYEHVPRGPSQPACLPLLLLSTAVSQHQTLTSWISTLPESQEGIVWKLLLWPQQTPATPPYLGEILCRDGCGAPGPGAPPAPGAHCFEPDPRAHGGTMPVVLPVLFCHAAVHRAQQDQQHPAADISGERERDGDVSMMCHRSARAQRRSCWCWWF